VSAAAPRRGVAVVAGGSGAIGRSICRRLAATGYDVALTYNSNAEAAAAAEADVLAAGRAAMTRQLALNDANAVGRVVEDVVAAMGGIDAAVYAAGPHLEFAFISEIRPEDWRRVFDADVNGCFNFLSASLPHLRRSGAGAIVAVTTCATEKAPVRDILSAAPKVAVEMLVKGIAKEEGRYGVRANCVAPGFMTDGVGGRILARDAQMTEMIRRQVPLRRFGAADDVANMVGFLLSDEANYISGQSIAVDGGYQL